MTGSPTFGQFTVSAWISQERLVRALLGVEDLAAALEVIRRDLNGVNAAATSWWAGELPPGIAARRDLLLHDVCQRLAQLRGLEQWPMSADLLPAAPDDTAWLDTP